MEIRKAEEKDLPAICRMVSARMVDSVEASFLLEGISDKSELTNQYMSTQIAYRYRNSEIWVADECQGVLVGYYGGKTKMLAALGMSLNLLRNLRKHLTKADTKRMAANMKQMVGAQNSRWRKQACGNSNYYFIDLIVIDKQFKGSGIFRKLIVPILERAKCENVPVLLDTHDKGNVPIYRHFGFELAVEHHAQRDTSIVQFSMIKQP